MSVNMLLYWMYAIRLNAPQRCAWKKKKKKKPIKMALIAAHLNAEVILVVTV